MKFLIILFILCDYLIVYSNSINLSHPNLSILSQLEDHTDHHEGSVNGFRIVSKYSSMCLEVHEKKHHNGAFYVQNECNDEHENQRFRLVFDTNGRFKIIAKHSRKVMHVHNHNHDNHAEDDHKGDVVQWFNTNAPNQHFRIVGGNYGYYEIINHNHECLQINSHKHEKRVTYENCRGGKYDKQLWALK